MLSARSRLKSALLVCFGLATLLAIAETTLIAPALERMRLANETQTPRFRSYHGASMGVYVAEAGVLLIAGLLLPRAIFSDRPRSAPRARAAADSGRDQLASDALPHAVTP